MGHVADEHHVAGLASDVIAGPLGRVVRLEAVEGGELRERIAGAQKRLAGLAGAQLAAVVDRLRPTEAAGRFYGETGDRLAAGRRQRALRIDVRSDGVAVVYEVEDHRWPSTTVHKNAPPAKLAGRSAGTG